MAITPFSIEAFNASGFGPRATITRTLAQPPPPPVPVPGAVQGFSVSLVVLSSSSPLPPSPPAADPYAIDTADLANIPWHNGAGNWGVQVPIQVPSPPTTSTSVTVSSLAALEAQGANSNIAITLDTSISESSIADFTGSHIDLIIPPGVVCGAIVAQTGVHHFRVRGSTAGTYSGGRIGQFRGNGSGHTDIIIDGVDCNSAGSLGTGESHQAFRPADGTLRFGVYRCRVISGAYTSLGGVRHCVYKDSSFFHGAMTRAQAGYNEGWGLRHHMGPFTMIGCDLRGTRYVNLRLHNDVQNDELGYMCRSRFVAYAEGRAMWLWRHAAADEGTPGDGAIVEDCEIYGHSDCGIPHEMSIVNSPGEIVTYSRVRNNDFFNSAAVAYDQTYLNTMDAQTGDHDWSSGNTFSTWTVDPAWNMNSVGDPTTVPLPGAVAFSYGEASCVGFPNS